MIMLIVGSDVAKAFTMMGAFSIIRFRNNMKETRDIGFIFLVMAIGMARILTIRIAPKKFEDGLFDEIFEKY